LIIFAKYLSLYLHIFTCTYRGTHAQAHMFNQHTRGMATTRHRSLVERGGRKALFKILHPRKKKCQENPILTNLKKRFEHIELPAKLLDYFLLSNKININQSQAISVCYCHLSLTCPLEVSQPVMQSLLMVDIVTHYHGRRHPTILASQYLCYHGCFREVR